MSYLRKLSYSIYFIFALGNSKIARDMALIFLFAHLFQVCLGCLGWAAWAAWLARGLGYLDCLG